MKKPTPYRVHLRTVMASRKSCPECGAKLAPGKSIWSAGEYPRGKWRTITYFCRECFQKELVADCRQFEARNQRVVELAPRDPAPSWLTLEAPFVLKGE